jgi:hypothetical protein
MGLSTVAQPVTAAKLCQFVGIPFLLVVNAHHNHQSHSAVSSQKVFLNFFAPPSSGSLFGREGVDAGVVGDMFAAVGAGVEVALADVPR